MPALITHYLQADAVLDHLKKQKEFEIDAKAFLLGAQGPDFLFFDRALPLIQPGKSLRNAGTLLHQTKPDDLFSYFAAFLQKNENDRSPAFSYTLGFLCHYALDRTAHPFVYWAQDTLIRQKKIKYNPSIVHTQIENSIDIILLLEKTGVAANRFDMSGCVTNAVYILSPVSKMLDFVIHQCDPASIATPKKVNRAFCDMFFLHKAAKDRFGIKHALIRGLEILVFQPPFVSTFVRAKQEDARFDYTNSSHAAWYNVYDPDQKPRTETFLELFDRSVEDALGLIHGFCAQKEQKQLQFTGNLSFKTGLVWETAMHPNAGKGNR